MSSTRQLFGGAITVTLPKALVDASDLRQVPDTQEVFLYPDSGVSIIVEVLERVEPSDPLDAARFHFDSLAHDNSAKEQSVMGVTLSKDRQGLTPAPVTLSGSQRIQKFNSTDLDEVQILLALYRLEDKNVDLVMSMNIPKKTSDDGAVGAAGIVAAEQDFNAAASSLKIVDFGLFA